MDDAILSALTQIRWTGDRLGPADIKPRHIGRVVTFTIVPSSDLDDPAYVDVIGTLEGQVGNELLVSGDSFSFANIINVRVWRKEIEKSGR